MRFVIEKEFEYNGFNCRIVGMSMGHRCGYVEIPESHKLHGIDYNELEFDVHGGLTYSGYRDDKYLIGFDCAHYGDGRDHELMKTLANDYYEKLKELDLVGGYGGEEHVWTAQEVEEELKRLVDQL